MPLTQSTELVNSWLSGHPYVVALVVIWSLIWKGFALWQAAERNQKYWFIIILVLNTLGILEIFYIYVIAKKYKIEVVEN